MILLGFVNVVDPEDAWREECPIVPQPGDIIWHGGRKYVVSAGPREFDEGWIIMKVVEANARPVSTTPSHMQSPKPKRRGRMPSL